MLEDMNSIEKQVYRTYWNDGMLDLFGAVAVLAIGIFWTFDVTVGAALVPALLVPLWAPCRQRFVEPRLGMVQFSDERERRNNDQLKMIAALGASVFVMGIALYFFRERLGVNPSISFIAGLPAILLGLLAVLTAFVISSPRFLVYAAVLVGAGILGGLSGLEPGQILMIAGGVMLLLALLVFSRFIRDFPIAGDSE